MDWLESPKLQAAHKLDGAKNKQLKSMQSLTVTASKDTVTVSTNTVRVGIKNCHIRYSNSGLDGSHPRNKKCCSPHT